MTSSCVRQLDLRLSLPGVLRSQSSQIADELKHGFITRVVETIEQRLHASFGADAIIEIPVLYVKWDGERDRFYDFDYAVQVGEGIAYELLMQWQGKPRTERLQPVSDDSAVKYYECAAHKQAQQLQLLAESCQQHSNAWNVNGLQQQWHQVCSETDEILQQVLEYSDEMSSLKIVVETISLQDMQLATRVLPISRWPPSIQATAYERLARANCETNARNHETDVPQEKTTEAPDQQASESTNLNQGTDTGQKTSAEASRDEIISQSSAKLPENNIYPLNTDQLTSEVEQKKAQTLSSSPDLLSKRNVEDSSIDKQSIADSASVDSVNSSEDVVNDTLDELTGIAYYETAYGGLFYVLNLLLRIELPEILWCAAIDEKSFLFDLAVKLIDDDGKEDAAVYAMSGVDFDKKDYAPSVIPIWAWEEVVRKVYRNIGDRLPESSQAKFHSRYPDANIEKIINTQKSETKDTWISLVDICHSLISAAFLCALSPDDSDHTFINHIKAQGVIKESVDEVSVELPMESIDIDVRRAALDVNPGYLQWQRRHHIIIFTE